MRNIAVLGAGIMGHGAAQLFAQAGYSVRIQARRETSLEKAKELMTNSLKIMVEKEILTQSKMDQTLANLTFTTDLHEAIQDVDFILESIPEVLESNWIHMRSLKALSLKKQLLHRIHQLSH